MGWFTRAPASPFAGTALKCAYCLSDYLDWERAGDAAMPVVNTAVTVIPATVDGVDGGAAVCVPHLKNLTIARRLSAARRHRETARNGATAAQAGQPVPRITPEAAQA